MGTSKGSKCKVKTLTGFPQRVAAIIMMDTLMGFRNYWAFPRQSRKQFYGLDRLRLESSFIFAACCCSQTIFNVFFRGNATKNSSHRVIITTRHRSSNATAQFATSYLSEIGNSIAIYLDKQRQMGKKNSAGAVCLQLFFLSC